MFEWMRTIAKVGVSAVFPLGIPFIWHKEIQEATTKKRESIEKNLAKNLTKPIITLLFIGTLGFIVYQKIK